MNEDEVKETLATENYQAIKDSKDIELMKVKEKLDQAENANRDLVAKLLSTPDVVEEPTLTPVDIDKIIDEHNNFSGTNRQYAKITADALDVFLNGNEDVLSTFSSEILESMRRTRDGFKYMVENSEDDREFIDLFKDIVQDSNPILSTKLQKSGGLLNYLASK